jgi:predicted phosphodiesterase
LRLAILSDLHRTTNPHECAWWQNEYDFAGHLTRVERALAWFKREAVDALVLCGDLTHAGGADAMSAVLSECCAGLEVPVIAVSGNHDVAEGEDLLADGVERVSDGRLVRAKASGELVSGIRVAGVQLAPTSGYMRSRLHALPAVEDWRDEPVVLVSHLPLLSRASAVASHGMAYPGDLLDRERAAAVLQARSAATIVVSGHIHVRDAHTEGPVLQLLQAAMVEPPYEAAVLDVRADADGGLSATRRTHRTSDQRAAHEPTLVEPVGSWRFVNGCWAVAEAGTHEWQDRIPVAEAGTHEWQDRIPVGEPIACSR